jgi:DNA-binding NarL/FixJ family response regulator
MAPALIRRAYGVARTAPAGYVLTAYMSGIAVAFLLMNSFLDYCIDYDLPAVIPYAVNAFLALPAWFWVRRHIGIVRGTPDNLRFRLSMPLLLVLVSVGILILWLVKMRGLINYTVEEFDDILYIPVYYFLPTICWILFGIIGDKGREKISVIGTSALFLISIQLAFLVGDPTNPAVIPLVVLNHFFGFMILYFILAIPVYAFKRAKRPVFAASLGIASYMLTWLLSRLVHPIIPRSLLEAGTPLFVATAIPAIVLLVLLNFVFQRHREKTLAAALYALFHGDAEGWAHVGGQNETGQPPSNEAPGASETRSMENAGFTPEEIEVAMLLIEGETQRDAYRKLHLSVEEFNARIKTIREKVSGTGDPDPVISAIVREYGLTPRETDMLRYLQNGKTNAEIALEVFLSEGTIKIHVRNVLNKLPVGSRQNVAAWVKAYGEEKKL